MKKEIKAAVIGLGNIARDHIRAYHNNPHVRLYALCSHDLQKAAALAEEYGVPHVYTDAQTMLRELPELDAVSICSWNRAHRDQTVAALNAGCHVLCEKPMALNAGEARQMARAAQENRRLLMIGYVCRFSRGVRMLKRLIQEGTLGELYYGRAAYLRRDGSPGGWFAQRCHSGGGPLIDLGVHVLDLTRYLCGCPLPTAVYGAVFDKLAAAEEACDVEDLATAMIRYDNGTVIHLETSFRLHTPEDRFCIELFGTKGGAVLTGRKKLLLMGPEGQVTEVAFPPEDGFREEIDHFVDCILHGEACLAPAEDGITAMEIIDGIYRSAATGREVLLRE